ncbi:MAG: nucleotide exchange factor GrpE [Thermodesulfobacteriota bacterium]
MVEQGELGNGHNEGEVAEAKRPKRGAARIKEENEALKQQVNQLKGEVEQLRDKWMRAVADLENFKKRSAREREDYCKYASEELLREMLPVVDNLERALNHAGDHEKEEALTEGIQMTLRQFLSVMEKFGVARIQALHEPFDPSRHEAVMQVESADHQPNTVVQELERGYLLHDRLLRPAKVAVSKRTQT